ncbi:hypothetical protein C4553_00530 [Candidatus Parcubacteria bacterium]|nr:MAG: hypothetical protein C4553_00530 [Candidatus Parcubacteria bacterium]
MFSQKTAKVAICLLAIGALFLLSFWLAANRPNIIIKYHLDKFIHFFAGGFVGLLLSQLFRSWGIFGIVIFSVFVGLGWEAFEYFGHLYFDWPKADLSQYNYLLDTTVDEIAVALGAYIFLSLTRPE